MKAKVYVTLKKSVSDPQGQIIHSALDSLGFGQVQDARCGKVIELTIKNGATDQEIEKDLKTMCEKLLANTVIEEYRWEIER
jgi:phosphoribosylformylglycinamidine synthase subunit PurS